MDIRVSQELRRQIRIAAAEDDTAMGPWVRNAVEEKLERRDQETKTTEPDPTLDPQLAQLAEQIWQRHEAGYRYLGGRHAG